METWGTGALELSGGSHNPGWRQSSTVCWRELWEGRTFSPGYSRKGHSGEPLTAVDRVLVVVLKERVFK